MMATHTAAGRRRHTARVSRLGLGVTQGESRAWVNSTDASRHRQTVSGIGAAYPARGRCASTALV